MTLTTITLSNVESGAPTSKILLPTLFKIRGIKSRMLELDFIIKASIVFFWDLTRLVK